MIDVDVSDAEAEPRQQSAHGLELGVKIIFGHRADLNINGSVV
jgi:hypothetical protein